MKKLTSKINVTRIEGEDLNMAVPAHSGSDYGSEVLIEHMFDDPDLQEEFNALISNEDRLDYIEAMNALGRIEKNGTYTHEEMMALLGLD